MTGTGSGTRCGDDAGVLHGRGGAPKWRRDGQWWSSPAAVGEIAAARSVAKERGGAAASMSFLRPC
uniref:Uncharacterized protein n=1 Tax=Arundo donax TaxID=35708 RepID=A0A0A9AX68_ARUDO